MKTTLSIGAVIFGSWTAGAMAADLTLPPDDQMMGMASDTWNGIYAGAGLTAAYNVDFGETFGFADGIVGFNHQVGDFVFGAEAYLSGWQSNLAGPGISAGIEGRGGYLVTPDVLVFASGGAMHFITGGATYGQLGLGAEFAVAEHLSVDFEYKYWHQIGGTYQTHSLSTSLLWHF